MKKLEDFTLTELKAFVYDEIAKKEQAEKNIRSINALIGEKLNTKVEPESIGGTRPVDENDNKSGTE